MGPEYGRAGPNRRRIGLLYPVPDPCSPDNWSGTPSGLASGLRACDVEVVPVGVRLPTVLRYGVAALSRAGGKRGASADRTLVRQRSRTWALSRAMGSAGRLDGLLAMGTEMYDLAAVRTSSTPVATYDDSTLAQMSRHPDSDLRLSGFPEREVERWIERQAASSRAADMCCVSTAWAASSMIQDYGVDAERVRVVGIGHRPRTRPGGDDRDWGTPRFLFVGVDWKRKNGAALLEAFARVRVLFPDATVDVVGDHPPLSIEGVTGHGYLRRDDPAAQQLLDGLFATSTAFVLPSRFDPAGIAYLEAASAGVPVIATTEGGAGELLGDAALTVHPDDVEGLVEAMERLADPDTARRMGAAAARRAAGSTWVDVAARILETIGVVTADRGATS